MLTRNERALGFEKILAVVHVEHGIANVVAIAVARRQIDGDVAIVAEDVRMKAADVIESAAPDFLPAIGEPQRAPEGSAQRVAHRLHQSRISR